MTYVAAQDPAVRLFRPLFKPSAESFSSRSTRDCRLDDRKPPHIRVKPRTGLYRAAPDGFTPSVTIAPKPRTGTSRNARKRAAKRAARYA